MSDVLQIAMKYRSRLAAEVAKVDDFLRMAEEFSKERDPEERVDVWAQLDLGREVCEISPRSCRVDGCRRPPKAAGIGSEHQRHDVALAQLDRQIGSLPGRIRGGRTE